MGQYYTPYRSSSNNIKVELDLANYATKTDLNNITHLIVCFYHVTYELDSKQHYSFDCMFLSCHVRASLAKWLSVRLRTKWLWVRIPLQSLNITHVDVSSFASKTNLAALKTEVDKKDADKLKTTPADLAKLTNDVKHDVVKITDYNTKVTSIEAQIAGLTKNTVDNLADITKLKAIDTNSFVNKTKFSADINTLDDKIDGVEKQYLISGLATKTSLNSYLQTSTFNSKVTEVGNKIKDADIIAKSANTKVNTIRSNLISYATKAELATDITTIKNDYVTNASLSSQLNDLKSQHIATEVTGIDNKTKKKMLVIF